MPDTGVAIRGLRMPSGTTCPAAPAPLPAAFCACSGSQVQPPAGSPPPHFFLPGCLFAFVLKPTASCVSFLLGLSIIFRKPSLERWMLRKGPPWLCSHRAYADLWMYPQSWTIRSQVTSPHKILSAWRHRLHPMHSCISKGPTGKVPK